MVTLSPSLQSTVSLKLSSLSVVDNMLGLSPLVVMLIIVALITFIVLMFTCICAIVRHDPLDSDVFHFNRRSLYKRAAMSEEHATKQDKFIDEVDDVEEEIEERHNNIDKGLFIKGKKMSIALQTRV